MSDIKKLTKSIINFRNARDWKQFHNPKDVALSLMLEAAELAEHFQWKNSAEIKKHIKSHKKEISDELADVLYWVLLMSHDLGIDIAAASQRKLQETARNYPIAKFKGKHTKYTSL